MTEKSCFKEAVCVEVQKIFDSCSERDGIFDLPVRLNSDSPKIRDDMDIVKIRSAEVEVTCINVDPISFKSGYYAVDITYRFNIIAEAFGCDPCKQGVTLCGCAICNRRVILFGGCSNSKTFTSEMDLRQFKQHSPCEIKCRPCDEGSLPKATVRVVDPVCLDAKLVCLPLKGCHSDCDYECTCNCDCGCDNDFDNNGRHHHHHDDNCCDPGVTFIGDPCARKECKKVMVVSLGLFSIVQLSRPVSIIIPAYDYVLPTNKCSNGDCGITVSPCDIFEKLDFPTELFFPHCEGEKEVCKDCDCEPQC